LFKRLQRLSASERFSVTTTEHNFFLISTGVRQYNTFPAILLFLSLSEQNVKTLSALEFRGKFLITTAYQSGFFNSNESYANSIYSIN